VIGRIQALIDQYKEQYPRLTRSSRYDEVEAKEVAFKAFKVSYDRDKGYIGFKAGGEEFKIDCTRYDKLLLVFKDGHYKMIELPEKLFVGPDLVFCGVPERERIFTCAYTNREASYLKRFTFGGMILDKEYFCIPEKSRILYFEPDTPAQLYIKYKAAPHQKVSQQTCKPSELGVKGAKSRGNQISIKDVQSVNEKPPRNWDPDATTTELKWA
jgi:topoisomerase IV subunit A